MTRNEVRDLLQAAADPSFKEFNDKIVNCSAAPSLGIRVPRLREIAAQVVKSGWQEYVREMEKGQASETGQEARATETSGAHETYSDSGIMYQEEHMLWGMILGKAKMTLDERTEHLALWVPGILSWADCDTCVSTFKFMKKDQKFWYDYCVKWLGGGREFEVRFALVALMQYFVNDEYIERVLPIFAGRKADFSADTGQGYTSPVAPEWNESTPYYIKMAAAWALSVCFVKYHDLTWEVFSAKLMNPWVQNKAIQKCRESYRVSAEDKELLKSLKM